MKFLFTSVFAATALAWLASATAIPLEGRAPQEGAGDVNTWFKDRFCASGFASCGKAGTNGDPGNRCAMACNNGFGGAPLGWCQCSTGWYPDECITLGKYAGRTKC